MARRLTALAVAAVLAAAGPLGAQSGESDVPKAARKLLADKWKGWRLAPLDPQALACQRDGQPSAVAQGDFDGDGRADLALAVSTPAGARLAVVLSRLEDGVLYDVDALGDASASAWLSVQRRGARFRRPGEVVDDYFPAATLTAQRCAGPRTAYFWNGLGFKKDTIE